MATTVVATVNTVLLVLKTNETFLIGSFNNGLFNTNPQFIIFFNFVRKKCFFLEEA